jgi:hypothetical protein
MTITVLLAVGALWGTAGYRVHLAHRRPAAWRTALALSVASIAAAATGHLVRTRLDEWLGLPNVTNLGSRLALCVAVASAQLYLLEIREPDASRPHRRRITVAAAVMAAVSVAAWTVAPIHAVELADLADAPRHPASAIYAVTIYLYVAWFQVDLARFSHHNVKAARAADPPAAVAVALIGASAYAAIALLLAWTAHNLSEQLLDRPTPVLDRLAAGLFPVPIALLALGLLALPLLPQVAHRLAARRLVLRLDPLWHVLVSRHPHVYLPPRQDRLWQALDPRLAAQRRLIEISDALEEHRVEPPLTIHELAKAVDAPSAQGDLTAKDALVRLDDAPWPQPLIHLSEALLADRGNRGGTDAAELGRPRSGTTG